MRDLVLFFGRRRVPAAIRNGGVAPRCDASAAADVLTSLDKPVPSLPLRVLLLRVAGGACDRGEPDGQRRYDDDNDDPDPIVVPDMRTSLLRPSPARHPREQSKRRLAVSYDWHTLSPARIPKRRLRIWCSVED